MATGREEEEERHFFGQVRILMIIWHNYEVFFGKMRISMFNLEHPHRRDRAEFSHGRNEEILFMVISLCLLREHHRLEQFSLFRIRNRKFGDLQ